MMKYSILIPTRNGAKYLTYAIKSALSQSYSDCEVIVSVNHSSDNTYEVLREFSDSRLKILSPPKPLSMTAHFEWLLKHATGEWITIIGDDDALMPYFFQEMERLLKKWPETKALIANNSAHYFWNQCVENEPLVSYEHAKGERVVKAKKALLLTLMGIKSYARLPQLYTNGVIHRDVIEEIKKRSYGQFYHEINPDVYSAVAIATTITHYLDVGKPLFWIGCSPKSNGHSFYSTTYGKGSLEKEKIMSEFVSMAEEDRITSSKKIGRELWQKSGLRSLYVLSALHALPYKTRFKKRWYFYLVYPQVLYKISMLKKNEAKALKDAFKKDVKRLSLSLPLLYFLSLGRFLHTFVKWKRKMRNTPLIVSENLKLFPTIECASVEVARLLGDK